MTNSSGSESEEDLALKFHKQKLAAARSKSHAISKTSKKKPRQPNFSNAEILCAISGYAKSQGLFRSQKGTVKTGARKKERWEEIAKEVSLVNGVARTAKVVEMKVASVRSKVKGPEAQRLFKISLTGGGNPVETETDSTVGSQQQNSEDDIKDQIKRLALSTISKVQLIGIKGGFDLLQVNYQTDKQQILGLRHAWRTKYKKKLQQVFDVLKS